MQNLRYIGKNLFLEKLSVANILKKNKTPFYLYSESQIIFNYLKFTKTFIKTNPIVCFTEWGFPGRQIVVSTCRRILYPSRASRLPYFENNVFLFLETFCMLVKNKLFKSVPK